MSQPSESSDYTVTVSEAASLFGVSPATIRRWADEGKIVGRRTLGKQRRFRRADLEEALRGE